jgi:hypothetical protein
MENEIWYTHRTHTYITYHNKKECFIFRINDSSIIRNGQMFTYMMSNDDTRIYFLILCYLDKS